MAWYSGGIAEAIAESRSKSKLFVVYISGQDEPSQKMDKLWENEKVQELCKSYCVALKLDATSEGSKQFSAIYPVLCVPSVFFINNKGEIMDALAIMSAESEFVGKVENVVRKFNDATSSSSAEAAPVQTDESGPSPAGAEGASVALGPSDVPAQSRSEEEIRDQVQRLQEKIQEKRKQEFVKKKDEEKQREIERRELGKNVQKLKEAQQEAKLKKEIEERRKNKMEEKAARERVKLQIEQDKRDRAARFQQERNEREEVTTRQRIVKDEETEEKRAQEAKERSSHARLQFRMPDGSTFTHQFDATDTLQSAYDIVRQSTEFGASTSFSLSVTFPRRIFTDADRELTYRELGLAPSASLIVLPYQGGNSSAAASTSLVSQVTSFLLLILMLPVQLLQYIWSFVAGPAASVQDQTESATTYSPGQQAATRQQGDDASMDAGRQGNMTRLRDVKRGDEDEATWNGNSTQQL